MDIKNKFAEYLDRKEKQDYLEEMLRDVAVCQVTGKYSARSQIKFTKCLMGGEYLNNEIPCKFRKKYNGGYYCRKFRQAGGRL